MLIIAVALVFLLIGLGIGFSIDNMKAEHKWSEWKTTDESPILGKEGKILGHSIMQKRICEKTKEEELRHSSVMKEEAHEWSKWQMKYESPITRGSNTIGQIKVYERVCAVTGKVEIDKQQWKLNGE